MRVEDLTEIIGADFYTGVPDSLLKALCNHLMGRYGTDPEHHVIAANEGNCVGLAAGYHLATGKTAVVYLQNSGEGNIINPVASLLNDRVYGIPMLFIVGWRGEPGVHDEPQHVFQGMITNKLLEDLEIRWEVIDQDTTKEEVAGWMESYREWMKQGKQAAFVIKKGALTGEEKIDYRNPWSLKREEVLEQIVEAAGPDPIVSTTGKASRELFEIRERRKEDHSRDFLTVGSMGHASSIALGIALQKKDRRVWCVDGDGAALMHMGAMAVIGAARPSNLVHIVVNNGAHETVGGLPTALRETDLSHIAQDCGYQHTARVETKEELAAALSAAGKETGLTFIEVLSAIGARADLGRPTTSAMDNKREFMKNLGA